MLIKSPFVRPSFALNYWESWIWSAALAAAIAAGAVLRLIWVQDMEYKADEAWTFSQTQEVNQTGSLPWLGMPSSLEVRNPGMSVWAFVFLSKLIAANDPLDLARAVQILNILAILLLVAFTFRFVCKKEREPWLWAAALASLNPLSILFHRKIWPPSVLPIFTLLMLTGWTRRERRSGAFIWGLVGTCMGQIHVSGFFFAAGLALWACLFDRKRVHWPSLLSGTCVGALPLIPWIHYMSAQLADQPITTIHWTRWLEFKFWMRWVTEPIGLGLDYSLGGNFRDFLAYPIIGSQPTYLVLLLHLLVIAAAILIGVRAGYQLRQDAPKLQDLWIGRPSPTAFTQNAALWGFGILLTVSTLPIHRHYMIVTFPLQFVWLARLAVAPVGDHAGALKLGRTLLMLICVSQLVLSASFLGYIHVNQGAIDGDYGVAYGAQNGVEIHTPLDNVQPTAVQ